MGVYVICDIPGINYDTFVSGGCNGKSSFEEAFLQKYSDCRSYIVDGPAFLDDAISIKKSIGYYENDRETNLHWILNGSARDVFIKMDVAGAELPWIKSLTVPHLNKISQLVVKFNYPFSDYDVFDALNQTHMLVHFCPVDSAGNRKHKGVAMPNIFVCTYIHKRHYNCAPELKTDPIPAPIDNAEKNSGPINCPPFVTNPTKSSDGFGENFKLLIYSVMFAELHGCKFLYTPFKQMEHNYDMDPEYLAKKERLINFVGNFELVPEEDDANQQKPYVLDTFELLRFYHTNIKRCAESRSLDIIKDLFRANKTDSFDKSYMNVAIHIRRMNKEDYKRTNDPNACLTGMDVPDDLYLTSMSQVEQISGDRSVLIHIFSQGKPEDFEIYLKNNVVLHLNEDLESTFAQMVYADVLLTAPSALSYSAGLLSRGIVFYIEFCNPKLPHWNTVVGYKSTRAKHEFVVPIMTTIYYDPYSDKIEKV